MKKYIITLILLAALTGLFAQTTAPSFVLTDPVPSNETKDWVAGEFVKMTYTTIPPPGTNFSSSPDINNYVKASIDPFHIELPEGGETGPTPDDHGIVGTIPGNLSVSGSGSAIYSIPIEASPGISGMTPEISLIYTSGGADGVMGPGWTIGGISAISNVRENEYYSGEPDGFEEPSYFNTKQFTLDGQRLIQKGTPGTFPIAEYRTEDESFKRINRTSYGTDGFCFSADTKSGLKYYYGCTNDSRQRSNVTTNFPQRAVMSYFINKSSDRLGNEIIYNYTNIPETGECYLNNITYGNGKCIVKFIYEDRIETGTVDKLTNLVSRVYHYGDFTTFEVKKRLVKIESLYDNVVYRTYNLEYQKRGTTENRYLNKVELVGENNTKYNKTVFTWPEIPTTNYEFELNENLQNNGKPLVGDFNGDGLNDLCFQLTCVPFAGQDIDTKVVDMYKNNGDGTFTKMASIENHVNHFQQQVNIADYNGDGISDILLTVIADVTNKLIGDLYTFNEDFSFNEFPGIIQSYGSVGSYRADIGDFNGDGQADVLCLLPTHSICYYGNESSSEPLKTQANDIHWPSGLNMTNSDFVFADFTGNGRTDLLELNIHGNNYLYRNNVTQFDRTLVLSNIDYEDENDFLIGDFNGDMLSDLAIIKDDKDFSVYQCHGFSFVQTVVNKVVPIINTNNDESSFYTGDMNGDGRSDIIRSVSNKFGFDNREYVTFEEIVLISNINGTDLIEVTYNNMPENPLPEDLPYGASLVGDFNGDGCSDIFSNITRYKFLTTTIDRYEGGRLLSLKPEPDYIASVTNGLGVTSEITYKALVGDDRKDGETPAYPIAYLPGPLNIVKQISIIEDDYISNTEYEFKGPRVHMQGKGFLGYLYTKTSTQLSDTDYSVNKTNFKIDTDYYYLRPTTSLNSLYSDVNGGETKLLSVTFNSYDKITYPEGNGTSLRYFPYLKKTLTRTFELDGSFIKVDRTDFGYNDYGDLIYQHHYQDDDGSLDLNSTGTEFEFREINTNTYYTADETNWILGRMENTWVTQEKTGKDPIIRHSYFQYHTSGSFTGMLKKEHQHPWDNMKYSKEYFYYPNGNLEKTITSGTDFEDRTDKIIYDSDNRYVESKVNSLLHSDYKEYNSFTGEPTLLRDPNGLEVSISYDGLGHKTKRVSPNGVVAISAIRWVVGDDDDTPPTDKNPCYYTWSKSSGGPVSKHYFDKYGREIRVVKTGFDNQKIYVDKEYNKYGNLTRVSEPYFKGTGSSGILYVEYNYDKINRVIKQIAPGNRITSTDYAGLTTTTTNPAMQTNTSVVNAAGWLIESKDANNKSNTYQYYSNGLLYKIIDPDNNETELEYDIFGNRTKLDDPDLGITTFVYNPIGELLSKTTANGHTITYTYDRLGRLTSTIEPEGETTRIYDTAPNAIGSIASVQGPDNSEIYYYDQLSRLEKTDEYIDGELFTTNTTFDVLGRPKTLVYPSGYVIRNVYDNNSYLKKVTHPDNNETLWEVRDMNARGQYNEFALGNGLVTSQSFDPNTGLITGISTTNTQDLEYEWYDIANLKQRIDNSKAVLLKEEFQYDNLNRLDKVIKNGVQTLDMDYDDIGNILYKSDVGNYSYNGTKPHAVTSINGNNLPISSLLQSIHYTSFDKIKSINEGEDSVYITYGYNHNRVLMTNYENNIVTKKKYYAGGGIYEKVIEDGTEKQVHYIAGGTGLFAIYTITDNMASGGGNPVDSPNESFRFIHSDHLGSIHCITDINGSLIEEYSYDAWGKRRDPLTWEAFVTPPGIAIDKGFTGHEHLDLFDLVNMNGRMYDPVIGRFLSADPFTQMPEHTQGLNRYSYVMNNPLSLTDPSGYMINEGAQFFGMMVGMVVAGVTTVLSGGTMAPVWAAVIGAAGGFAGGVTTALINGANVGQALKAGAIGAAIGAVSALATYGIGELFKDSQKFIEKCGQALMHGVYQGGVRALMGGRFELGFLSGFASSLGASYSNKVSKKMGVIVGMAAAVGGTAEVLGGGKFANGAVTGAFVALFNHAGHQNNQTSTQKSKKLPSKTDGGYMETWDEAAKFCKKTANDINERVEVGFYTELNIDGDEVYFVLPWNENTGDYSINPIYKVGDVAINPLTGNQVIRQDHWAPKVRGAYTTGGNTKNDADYLFSVKIQGPVFHHDGGSLRATEYSPGNYKGIHYKFYFK